LDDAAGDLGDALLRLHSQLSGGARKAMVQWFQPAPLNTPSYRDGDSINRAVDGTRQCGVHLVHHNARESAEHHLDLAFLIATAFRSVRIRKANGNPLDRCAKSAKLQSELSADVVSILVIDRSTDDANVRRR
jgi:hypothetical protein